jgi:hypothetical protein
MAFGAWRYTEDGHTIAAQSLEEQGIELRSRENALHALVDIDLPLEGRFEDTESRRALYTIRMVQDWHIDGVMFHLARRCAALNGGILGRKSELMEMGIPVGTYEASEADPKEFNEIQVRENFDVFLDSLDGPDLSRSG